MVNVLLLTESYQVNISHSHGINNHINSIVMQKHNNIIVCG